MGGLELDVRDERRVGGHRVHRALLAQVPQPDGVVVGAGRRARCRAARSRGRGSASRGPGAAGSDLPVRVSHMTQSRPAVATSEPSGWKAIAYSARVCPSCSSNSLHVSTSHSRQLVSNDAVPTKRPLGWKATRLRRPAWPLSSPTAAPPIGQSFAFASHAAETRLGPDGLSVEHACGCHARPEIRSAWPRSVPRSEQSGIDHSFTRFDHEPVAHVRDPGANATNETGRSSPKLESTHALEPRAQLAEAGLVARGVVGLRLHLRALGGEARGGALHREAAEPHARLLQLVGALGVEHLALLLLLLLRLAAASASIRCCFARGSVSAPRSCSTGTSRSRFAAITSRSRSRRSGAASPKRMIGSPNSRSLAHQRCRSSAPPARARASASRSCPSAPAAARSPLLRARQVVRVAAAGGGWFLRQL